MVCVVVLSYSHMRSITNIFILNLAVSDLLVLFIVLIPTMIQDIFKSWLFGDAICPMANYLQRVSPMVSILTLTFISIERLYAVCEPLKFEATRKRACAMILSIWIISLASAIPDLLYSKILRKFPANITDLLSNCTVEHSNAFHYFYTFTFFVLPCLIMGVAYFKIARCLWTSPINNLSPGEPSGLTTGGFEAQLTQRRKTAKMLFAVVVCFFCCFSVHHIILHLHLHLPKESWDSDVKVKLVIIGHLLIYVNSALNPIIYNFMSERFRMSFLETCCCCVRRGNSSSKIVQAVRMRLKLPACED
ncbi:orexin/Hypocretin receptor type 1-like isoform X2 [Liolophura sinensis]|uniref:orexin/Hypocretin receptor type 1-like isoform X2 n=1 Tax=Liolophura sinensis TaxID=3198878 RepID=UPI003159849E